MYVGVGFSDNPDSAGAGREAALQALATKRPDSRCDFVLLFSTSSHDAHLLRAAVTESLGDVPIMGGGAVGAISNTRFGYAGDQVILAAFWLEEAKCELIAEPGLVEKGEFEVGQRLGKRLAAQGVSAQSPVVLFYDAINRTDDAMQLIMATPLLQGLKDSLGFFPVLTGAGLQGDYRCSPTKQWSGEDITQHTALALNFSGDVRMDTTIMHGCRPITGYYTVTKTDGQTILEINDRPALTFIYELLQESVPVENFPFSLILGVNRGNKLTKFDEKSYANRLCLAIDKERSGIVMFEPDMVAGTEFQVMYRSLDLGYMPPRIESLFQNLDGRKPVFALYINCAGRAAGYSGEDLEDAVVVQNTVAERVPLLGIYTGVEIAPVEGIPRGLDWTGVFCLFSVPQ